MVCREIRNEDEVRPEQTMADLSAVKAVVYGRVQGVFFRAFVSGWAERLGVTGYARNLPGGSAVEVAAEGERKQLLELIKHLHAGPPGARVAKVETSWSEHTDKYSTFQIRY